MLRKILITLILVGVVIFAGFSLFIGLNGKRMAETQLSEVFKRPARIGKVGILFPSGLLLDDFEIQGLMRAKAIRVHFNIFSLFQKSVKISRLVVKEPLVYISRTSGKIALGYPAQQNQDVVDVEDLPGIVNIIVHKALPLRGGGKPDVPGKHGSGFFIHELTIQKGRVQFTDDTLGGGLQLTLKDVELQISNLVYPPKSVNSKIAFTAVIESDRLSFSGSRIESQGWVNPHKLDMQETLQITQPDGRKILTAELNAVNNDMTVKGKVDVGNFIINPQDKPETEESSVADFIASAIENMNILVEFAFQTKMNDFHVASLSLKGNVGYKESLPDAGF